MNKTVLITGATSGIGLGCARKFADNGDKLILTGRNEHRLAEIRKELTEKGAKVMTLAFDVRDREKAKKYITGLPEEWQAIDVLVNNAGLALGLEPEYEGNPEDWDTMIDTNVKGLLTMTRLIVPGMVVCCRRCRLCRRQRLLCHEGCCESLVRRSANRYCRYGHPCDEPEAGTC